MGNDREEFAQSSSSAEVPVLPSHVKGVLIDLAGVLHVADEPIEGAVEALQRLQKTGLPIIYVTNTTRSPRASIGGELRLMGFDVEDRQIFTAAMAAKSWVSDQGLSPMFLVHPDIEAEMGASAANPDAVVMGDMGPFFRYDILNKAFRLLMEGKPLIAMANNRYFKDTDGLSLDMGAFVIALEYGSGQTATVVGKPSEKYFQAALQQIGIAAHEAIMIGDDLKSDIGGAQAVGIPGMLVRTGKYLPADEHDPKIQASSVVDDFSAAVALIQQINSK